MNLKCMKDKKMNTYGNILKNIQKKKKYIYACH